MGRFTTSSSSAAIILLKLILLVLTLSPTTNCLSLDDRFQQLTQDFVRI